MTSELSAILVYRGVGQAHSQWKLLSQIYAVQWFSAPSLCDIRNGNVIYGRYVFPRFLMYMF